MSLLSLMRSLGHGPFHELEHKITYTRLPFTYSKFILCIVAIVFVYIYINKKILGQHA
jgi:hypothetical protein